MVVPPDSVDAKLSLLPALSPADCRPTLRGKFFFIGDKKFYVRGVTYGPFRPDSEGNEYGDPATVAADFSQMAANGINAVRTYTAPPGWFLDLASRYQLRVMIGLPWEQHVTFLDDGKQERDIRNRLCAAVRKCAGHPAVLCYTIGNEIPASIVRWHGARRIERFLESLYRAAKAEDPAGLFTYVNYPSTEYLKLPFLDFVSFNVYLEKRDRLEAYLARLQNLAGDRPLLMAEVGLDSLRHGEEAQAESLAWQIRTVFASGCAGAFAFAWTDQWYRGGFEIEDWDFGLVTRQRLPKPALSAIHKAFGEIPFAAGTQWPRISVVVCSYNGARTIRDCFEALQGLDYPNYEVIVVNDGSKDRTAAITNEYGFKLINTENRGLSCARNTGAEAAAGEIVAYIDDDAYPDPDWLKYLAHTFMTTDYAAVGGPNIAPHGDGAIAECVAHAPGGPVHVLLNDRDAEHIPGCNMAFRKSALMEIGGFDPRFRTAGDDVDVCWRIQQQGWQIGFNPAAMVWHHRRNSLRAYWRQQKGYGKAEALLEAKWPEKYNSAGHVTWSGRIYGNGLTRALGFRPERIYQGSWGSALFQSIYEPAANGLSSLPLMPEWYLLISALALIWALALSWRPLIFAGPFLGLAVFAVFLQATRSANHASPARQMRTRIQNALAFSMIAFLHLLQPLARLIGRIRSGLTVWRRRGRAGLVLPRPRKSSIWGEEWHSTGEWLAAVEEDLVRDGAVVQRGGDFDRWDLQVRGGLFGCARMLMTIEEHGAGKQLVRFRTWPKVWPLAIVVDFILAAFAAGAAIDHAWVAWTVLTLAAAFFSFRVLQETSVAEAAILYTLEDRVKETTYLLPSLETSKVREA
jgi:GT2 family glycosyltransferase